MADSGDYSSDYYQRLMDEVLKQRQQQREERSSTLSAETCWECGDIIPDRRRQAIPGVQYCVSCQEDKEMQQR